MDNWARKPQSVAGSVMEVVTGNSGVQRMHAMRNDRGKMTHQLLRMHMTEGRHMKKKTYMVHDAELCVLACHS